MELTPPNDTIRGPENRFTGDVYVTMIKSPTPPSTLVASLVRFTPGARTRWLSRVTATTPTHLGSGPGSPQTAHA